MTTALIIEDELPNIQRLKKLLNIADPGIEVLASLQTVKDSIEWLSANPHPDVIFMDIRLTDGISFEIFNAVKITTAVIFITAYDEYALKAFEVNGIDYLLKPLEADKLDKALKKAKLMGSKTSDDSLLRLIKSMQVQQPIYRSRFLVNYRDRYIIIPIEDIAYFSSEHKTTFIIMHNAQRYAIDQTLESLAQELDPSKFFRASRQIIVCVKAVGKITQSFNGQIKIELNPSTDEGILLSREKSGQLKKWLGEF